MLNYYSTSEVTKGCLQKKMYKNFLMKTSVGAPIFSKVGPKSNITSLRVFCREFKWILSNFIFRKTTPMNNFFRPKDVLNMIK